MIKGFADKITIAIFRGRTVKRLDRSIQRKARIRLQQIDAAKKINDLRNPPSNRLEKKSGNMRRLHCLRVNDQWRICFRWEKGDAYEVRLCDYH